MSKLKYVGLFLIILIFGILFIPKIFTRIAEQKVVDSSRSQSADPLQYIFLNGEAKKVPEFAFLNQDSLLISNEDFTNKVYVVEFFFTSCPSICHIMNKNMKRIEELFGNREDFGIASFKSLCGILRCFFSELAFFDGRKRNPLCPCKQRF